MTHSAAPAGHGVDQPWRLKLTPGPRPEVRVPSAKRRERGCDAAERHEMTPTHVLLTHHHHDHVAELAKLTDRWPDMEVLAHPDERVDGVTGDLAPDETLRVGDLEVRALHTPGHTKGMLSLLVAGNV